LQLYFLLDILYKYNVDIY